MSDTHDLEHFKKNVKACIVVFALLMVLTLVTVLISFHDFGHPHYNIAIALVIATVKALMVAAYFMHLNAEKRTIFRILYFTGAFAAVLIFVTLWCFADPIRFIH